MVLKVMVFCEVIMGIGIDVRSKGRARNATVRAKAGRGGDRRPQTRKNATGRPGGREATEAIVPGETGSRGAKARRGHSVVSPGTQGKTTSSLLAVRLA